MVPAHSHKVPRVSWYSGSRHVIRFFAYGAFTLSGRLSQNRSAKTHESITRSEPRRARTPVWALSISLAATLEIDVSFSSSGYLDVSVHRVPLHTLWIGVWIHGFTVWVSPFRYPWIVGYVLLPMAFRSLSRLSSALSAKASTLRSSSLDLLFQCISVYTGTVRFDEFLGSRLFGIDSKQSVKLISFQIRYLMSSIFYNV